MKLLRALALSLALGALVYLGALGLDGVALDTGSSEVWALLAAVPAAAFTFVNEFFFNGTVGGGYHKGY